MFDPAYNDYISVVVTDDFYRSLDTIESMHSTALDGNDDAESTLWDMYAAIEVLRDLPYHPTPLTEMQQVLDQTIESYFGGHAWFYDD